MTDLIPIRRELLERLADKNASLHHTRKAQDELRAAIDSAPCDPRCAETCVRASMCATCMNALAAPVQSDGWIPVIERLPQIKQVLSEKCTIEGREIPTLYRSGMVLTFDGSRVSAGIVEWFRAKSPLSGVTHWMPLPKSPEESK